MNAGYRHWPPSFATWAPAGVGNEGSEGRKSPSGIQGQIPGGGLGKKPPEADNIFSNNA